MDEIPSPDPKVPWMLSHNDKRMLRMLRIAIEDARRDSNALPYQSNPRRVADEEDGA